MKINIEDVKNEIDPVCGALESAFSNVIANEGDEEDFSRLDDIIQQIQCIRDDLTVYYTKK